MFAWFDHDSNDPIAADLWADDLERFDAVTSPAEARALLEEAEAEARARSQGARGPCWVFALDFECAPWFDRAFALAFAHRPAGRLRLWRFGRYQWLPTDEATAQAAASVVDPVAGLLDWQAGWRKERYRQAFDRVQHYLREGDCYQVNLTFPWHAVAYGDPLALYLHLKAAQAVPHGAYLPLPDGGAILCRSPELFFSRQDDEVVCRPMKGTARPGASGWVDEKTRAENVMIVDLIRNDLSRLAPQRGVAVPVLFREERYATVTQLTSTIVARGVSASLWEILAALFPCGSVTGAPKRRALEIITELETQPRGLYCGALGYLLPGGTVKAIVPIRTLEIDAARRATLGVGSGVVIDSDAHAEWRECALKTRFVRNIAPPVGLIETLRWERGHGAPLWRGHLARARRSARALGIPFSEERFTRAVEAAVEEAEATAATLRVRVEIAPNGACAARATPWAPPETPVRFCVSDAVTIDPDDPLQRHKTTRRHHYDALLAAAVAEGLFDAVVMNRRGELVEGCRSTLFLRFPGESRLATPPLASGCLAGVLRAQLLASGTAYERTLTPADWARAEAVYLGNALHGLLPALRVPSDH